MHAPVSVEGRLLLALLPVLARQVRVSSTAVLGYDWVAARCLAEAHGIAALVLAELLPAVEAVMVEACREEDRE